jgi:hypothetical protein
VRSRKNLETSLLTRYGAREDGGDIDPACAVFAATMNATAETSPNLPMRLNNLDVAAGTDRLRAASPAVRAPRRAAAA